jgi:hypothetical protein
MSCLSLTASLFTISLCVACASSDIPTAPSAADQGADASLSSTAGAGATGGGSAAFAGLRQATAAFHDVSAAVAAGYLPPHANECVASPAGAMGVHAVHPPLLSDQTIDPLRPEVLLYLPKNGGGFRLVGVEYLQTVLVRNKATGAVSPWFAPTPWPSAEYDAVTQRPSAFGQAFDGPMAGHEPGQPWHYDLHVWAWAPNPSGDFAQFNPRLSCVGGDQHAH